MAMHKFCFRDMTLHDREPKPFLSKVAPVLTFPHTNYPANLNVTFLESMNFICLSDQICLLYLQLAAVLTRGYWDTGTLRIIFSDNSLWRALCSESFHLWDSLVPWTIPQGSLLSVLFPFTSDWFGLQVHLQRTVSSSKYFCLVYLVFDVVCFI